MNAFLDLAPVDLGPFASLRREVRHFLNDYKRLHNVAEWLESWEGFSSDFSRALGRRGWIGMTWPKVYGGHERSILERHVVVEELLAAGAPVAAHWIADRQSGPQLLRFGTETQCRRYLPHIAAGECYFCIGMSEPDSGSDLASIRARATKVPGGWRLRGTKLWTTYAHRSHYMLALCRTSEPTKNRHQGMSQFIIDLADPAVDIRPIHNISGEAHFNEVVFHDVFLADEALLGVEGQGWGQVMSELTSERSGPDRFLSLHRLLEHLLDNVGEQPDALALRSLGRLASHLWTLRGMSAAIAAEVEAGRSPDVAAALVKDLGTRFEQDLPGIVRQLLPPDLPGSQDPLLNRLLDYAILHTPSYSIRGGTREVLRGIIARGLGLR